MQDITFKQVEEWILANREDTLAMDSLNATTYRYTSKYLASQRRREEGNTFGQ